MSVEKDIVRFSDDREYYADNSYVTNSMLSKLNKGPEHLQHYLDGGVEESPALNFGKAFHLYILEKDKYDTDVAVFLGKTRRGKEWEAFSKAHVGKTIISFKEALKIKEMEESLFSKKAIKEALTDSDNSYESVAIGNIYDTPCKGKADIVNDKKGMIIDLKTTQSVNPKEFRRSCYKYGYHRQAYFYKELFKANQFMFICVEKEPPYSVGIFHTSDEFIEQGQDEVIGLLEQYNDYFQDDFGREMLKNYFVNEEL
tara:strand:- start:7226 stop:7993 length:768 start_codon:yes stop_codon:yes gene_type:complete